MGFVKTVKNIWSVEDLRKRIGITLLLVIIYRFGCYVVLPGINPDDLTKLKEFSSSGLMQLLGHPTLRSWPTYAMDENDSPTPVLAYTFSLLSVV